MKSQYIKLFKKQIAKLEDADFDLEAWKTGTITVLHRTFGERDTRVKQIDQLKIDYSSWALRDSNSNYKPVETAKRKGREILNTVIGEIEVFGVPKDNTSRVSKFAEELQTMNKKERQKYFRKMKKEKLVELLTELTARQG